MTWQSAGKSREPAGESHRMEGALDMGDLQVPTELQIHRTEREA